MIKPSIKMAPPICGSPGEEVYNFVQQITRFALAVLVLVAGITVGLFLGKLL